MNMLRFVAITLAGVGLGALMGVLGKCTTGTCPFTANPWRGALFGLIIGGLLALIVSLRQGGQPAVEDKLPRANDKAAFQAAVLEAKGLVLVDFYADWCGPCRKLAPIVAQIAAEKAGLLAVVKVNVDAAQALAAEYGVSGIPHLILFRDGAQVASQVGYTSKAALEKWLAEYLAPETAPPATTPPPPPPAAGETGTR